ncbi:serine/threonine protein kinase [Actinoallomurus purpureus]|uniref:serine/threonine protein kinase n=1 Tax=Actinoallomurus purpureus TaxID=478114 RepID=UPI0020936FF9|nr:serine/threonine-protein kinase [Actinoallomurus purpureus]MCO6011117.1 serine/threonine protein kinase [Actinoallomurus purpureus]
MPDAAPLEPGDPAALGQYRVVGRLGAGGQGAVFLGRSPSGGHVAIKLLHEQMNTDSSARTRFAREAEAAQKVSPFCTAQVLDYDLNGQPPYIISEYIDGPPLYDVVLQEGPFEGAALERLAIGTATALAAIHEAGIVHRDFKPNNVLLASDGPRVVDFGIARSVDSQQSSVTATGMVVGTPGYLAPEQLTGEPLTPSVDIFAWGATMVFAATGRSPFEAETLPVIINRILNEEPDLSRLHGIMRELVAAALDKNTRRRPAAHQLLLRLLGQVGAAPGPAADRNDLLDKGTQIAAQLPPPPPIIAAPMPPMHPGPSTPPPMRPGPSTPPPMMPPGPATPNPMMRPGPQTPPPWQGQGQPTHPVGARYVPPPPQKKSTNAPLFVGLGCLVALILVIGVPIAIGAGLMKKTESDRLPSGFDGAWSGTGSPTSSEAFGTSQSRGVELTLYRLIKSGNVRYDTCSGSLDNPQISDDKKQVTFQQTLTSFGTSQCLSPSYVTLTLHGSSMTWQMSQTAGGTPLATGTLTK